MVLMNYHEMTMDQPRDSPARRQQFLLICGVMASVFLYSSVTSGIFQSLPIQTDETFSGGTFVYKSNKRDYAASGSLERHVAQEFELHEWREMADTVYSVFLDDPASVQDGRRTRFASGVLMTKQNTKELAAKKKLVMAKNKDIEPPTKAEIRDLAADDLWRRLKFKEAKLPTAKVNLVHFPYTNGFISALVLEYRILPALRKSIADPASIIFSTCSVTDSMCTHYVTVDKAYLLGQPDTIQYQASLPPPTSVFSLEDAHRMIQQTSFGKYLGYGEVPKDGKDEL